MFTWIKQKTVIVTGPHRSGTTIATEMIAHDLGYEPVKEERFGWTSEERFKGLIKPGVVIQAPAVFHLMEKVNSPDILFVLMVRDLKDIAESRDRMYVGQRKLSPDEQNDFQLKLLKARGDAAQVKYEMWPKMRLDHKFELEYESLKKHPFWVDEAERRRHGTKWHNRRTA